MFEQFSNITQQQLILLVGILVILLLLLDAFRRIKRKRYQAKNKSTNDKIVGSKDQKENEKSEESEQAETIVAEKDESEPKPEEASDSTVEYQFKPVADVIETEEPEQQAVEPEEVLPEAKTWEEAVAQKRQQQMKANRSTSTDENSKNDDTPHNGDPNASTLNQGIIALHIMAPRNYVFYGEDLVSVFEHYQLSYNRELHTYQGISADSKVLFNITTAVKPGTFDLKKIADLQTPGISFFMDINTLPNPKEQFKQMLSLLYKVNEHLGGTLLNETRNRFTQSDVSRITASIKKLDDHEEK